MTDGFSQDERIQEIKEGDYQDNIGEEVAISFWEMNIMSEELKWYYSVGGKSVGPFAKDQLLALVFSDAISKTTPIWTPEGNQEWKPLEQVFSLKEELPPPLPSVSPAPSQSASNAEKPTLMEVHDTPHPWRRYLARILDTTINGSIIFIALAALFFAVDPNSATRFFNYIGDSKNQFIDLFLTCLLAPFINAAFIGFTGGSIGKWLFGVKVVNQQGNAIGYRTALYREFLVWLYGMGLGIPLINIGAFLHQHSQLNKNKITSWDRDLNLKIIYRPHGALQSFLSVLGVFLILVIRAILTKL